MNVHVASENRNKTNEFFFARSDISSVVLYYPYPSYLRKEDMSDVWRDTKVVLVREFRSPVRNPKGFVYELPGGSSFIGVDPLKVAADEVFEETGLRIHEGRFRLHETRQLVSTLSIHQGSLFSCELTEDEIYELEKDHSPHGNFQTDSEMTWIEVKTVREILDKNLVDWSSLGMILSCVARD